ncbi:MAG TPA: DUF2752 domain-containing protein [bacterium]|nr:DUF2752 domain-containing protein [bacterium]
MLLSWPTWLTGSDWGCLFRHYTGIPCPSCGATRACLCLLRGDVAGALAFNPGVVLGGVLLAAYLAWGFARARRDSGHWPRGPHIPAARWLALIAVLGNWWYVLTAGTV